MRKAISNKKILITGADGFLGSNITQALKEKNYTVSPFSGPRSTSKKFGPPLDISNFSAVEKAFKRVKPDLVIHAGALANLSRDFEVANMCIDPNIRGTLNVLEMSKRMSVEKIIFFSTQEIYGNNKSPYVETQYPDPPSMYSITKIMSESMCKLYKKLYDLNYVILRVANVYGPRQMPPKFIPYVINQALKNEDINISSSKNKRDYIYVNDLVRAILKVLVKTKANNQILNIGTGNVYTGYDLAKQIVELTKSTSKINLNGSARANEAEIMQLNIQKASKLLSWKPAANLKTGLKSTINYYRNLI